MPGANTGVDVFGTNGNVFPSGAAGVAGIQWIDVEDLGAFSTGIVDPDSLVSSYIYDPATKIHSIGLVALPNNPSGYVDYSIATTLGILKQPRAANVLVDETGTALTTDDEFTMLVKMEGTSFGTTRSWSVACGFTRDFTSTTKATVAYNSSGIGITGIGQPSGNSGFVGVNLTSSGLNNGDTTLGFIGCAGLGHNKVTGATTTIYSATDAACSARVGQATVSAATPLYLEVQFPTQGTTATTVAGTIDLTIKYAILRT